MDMSGGEPHANEGIGTGTSSDSSGASSIYCTITPIPKPVISDSQTNAPAGQKDLARRDISHHNEELYDGEYETDTGHTTTLNKCWWTTIAPAVQIHIPRPHISYHNKVFIADSGEYTKMDSSTKTDATREEGPPNHRSYIPGFHSMILTRTDSPICSVPPVEHNKKPDTNINWRRIKPVVLVVFICLSVSAVVAVIVVNKNVDDPVPTPFPPDFLTDKCNNQESVVSPGDRICIPYDDLHNTSRISHITIQQTSSTYSYTFFQFNMSVNSTVSNFTRRVDDWIVDYDISRIDQMLRLVQPKSYCSSTGKYIVILEYTDGSNTSFEFEVRMKDPQLHQSITFDDQGIHVHCELTGTCLPSSLAIYVTVNNSTLLVPDSRACSYNDRKTGTMVSIQATIPSSMFTKNQRIYCVPLMRDQELAENLTSTIPICHGPECKPNCQDDSATNMYFPDSVYCDKYYQYSNGEAIEKPCPIRTYWEPMNCTCAHDTTAICDINTHKRITPLRTLNPCA